MYAFGDPHIGVFGEGDIADEGGKTIEAVAHVHGRLRFQTQNGRPYADELG
jgi:hypothetical protein